jgi:hypothetical protein
MRKTFTLRKGLRQIFSGEFFSFEGNVRGVVENAVGGLAAEQTGLAVKRKPQPNTPNA